MDVRIGAEQRGAVPRGEPVGKVHAEVPEERLEIIPPRDRHGHVADRVLENQVPPDDPRDHLTERRVRVGIGAAGLGNHRRQLGVAEAGQGTADAQQNEREHERRSRPRAHHVAGGIILAGGGGADRTENAGADHSPDREHDQIAGTEDAAQRMRRVELAHQELGDRLALEELPHACPTFGVRREA